MFGCVCVNLLLYSTYAEIKSRISTTTITAEIFSVANYRVARNDTRSDLPQETQRVSPFAALKSGFPEINRAQICRHEISTCARFRGTAQTNAARLEARSDAESEKSEE